MRRAPCELAGMSPEGLDSGACVGGPGKWEGKVLRVVNVGGWGAMAGAGTTPPRLLANMHC